MDYTLSAREYFKDDLFATEQAGAVIEKAEQGHVICSMELTRLHKNARGAVMGGAIFTLCDFAFAVLANTPDTGTVTLSGNINFTGVAKGNKLIAEAGYIKSGRSTCTAFVEVNDELGNKVAYMTATGFRTASGVEDAARRQGGASETERK